MRIRSIEAIPVRVPRAHLARSAFGTRSATHAGIIRLETDGGIVGWGEISLVWWREGAGLCPAVRDLLAPALLGEDVRHVARLSRRMEALLPGRTDAPARAGVEMAMLDAVGRAAGLPVHALLGGSFRDTVPLSYSIHMDTPERMAEAAGARAAEGFRTLKVKLGRDWHDDLAALAAVRERIGPQVRLRVDVNEAWRSVADAVGRIRQLVAFDVEVVEQPLAATDLAGMAELRARADVAVAADESVWTPQDAWQVLTRRAADVLNVYVSEAGGLLPARQMLDMAALGGARSWVGSMPELGIGTAANVHLGAALPELDLACDACGFLYHDGDVLAAPLTVRDGEVVVPDAPGLGVEVDPAELGRWRTDR